MVLYIDEISEEEAKTFIPDSAVTNNYNYKADGNSVLNGIKMNAYGFFAEFKHYERLRRALKKCKVEDLTDEMLADIRNIEEANVANEISKKTKNELVIEDIIERMANGEDVFGEGQNQEEDIYCKKMGYTVVGLLGLIAGIVSIGIIILGVLVK